MSRATSRDRAGVAQAKPGLEEEEVNSLAQIGAALVGRLNQAPERTPLTLTETGAAKKLGVSSGFFKAHVLPELRVIRLGSRVMVPLSELERWIDRRAARTVE